MCKEENHIVFCSCSEDTPQNRSAAKIEALKKVLEDKVEYNQTCYTWILQRIIRKHSEKESALLIGSIILPLKRLDTELSGELVVKQLNEKLTFDFEYVPKDGDQLSIYLRYKYVHIENHSRPPLSGRPMKFVYEEDEWYFGYIDNFKYRQEELRKGEVKLVNNDRK